MAYNKMKILIWCLFYLMTAILIIGCNRSKTFTKKDWNEWDGHYHEREFIINDLQGNYLHKGMSYMGVIDLLGTSFTVNDNEHFKDTATYITYEVSVGYRGIDPVSGSYLKIEFSNDSLVTNYEVIKWKQ